MPAMSPSPQKRPSLAERSSSTHSLSSSGRQSNTNVNAPKGHRVHVVTKHSRNVSHGKNLNRLGKVATNANITGNGKQPRKPQGPGTPTESPKTPTMPNIKRNSSHVALPKSSSHVNLRKNHSASALALKKNRSHGALQKLGAPASQKAKDKEIEQEQKHGVFALGDQSSEGEEAGDWEDSTTQSPEMSRAHSKTSTPMRPLTPNTEPAPPLKTIEHVNSTTSDPPEPSVITTNRSAPNLRRQPSEKATPEPTPLQAKSRSSKAPPAMSTITAQVASEKLPRNDSMKELSKMSKSDNLQTNLQGTTPGVGTASSGSGGVSHFLQSSSLATSAKAFETGSDEDSTGGFLSNYKPQPANSQEQPKSQLNKLAARAAPSRTNQKMELQRRETMRAGSAVPATPGPGGLGLKPGSTISLHSRSGSKVGARGRSVAGEMKALKQDYETALKQLVVVRRFRNPILDSLHRLQDNNVVPSPNPNSSGNSDSKSNTNTTTTAAGTSGGQPKGRPQTRSTNSTGGTHTVSMAQSPEDKRFTPDTSHSASQARTSGGGGGRVQFQMSRQGSHDDIQLTTSQGSPDGFDDDQDGMAPEEALIRRIWESRLVFENDGVQTAA